MSFQPRSLEELSLTFPPELDHLSASSMAMAVRCEEQWRQRYILGKLQPPALAPILGKADHSAIAKSMEQKVTSGIDLPLGDVRELFVAKVEEEVDSAGGLKEIEVRKAETLPQKRRAYDEARRQGQELVGMYQQRVSPAVVPLAVEQKFEIELPDLPVVMWGFIDLVAQAPEIEAQGIIIDRKRVGQAATKPKPDWLLQAEIYQMVKQLPFFWHLSVTTKEPKIIVGEELYKPMPPYERTLRLVQQIAAKLGFLYMRYGPDEPWPTTGKLHPWACSYCGYRDDCWGWQE